MAKRAKRRHYRIISSRWISHGMQSRSSCMSSWRLNQSTPHYYKVRVNGIILIFETEQAAKTKEDPNSCT